MNLYDRLAEGFPRDRSRPCFLLSDGGSLSYGEVEAGAARVAGFLVEKGVQPGDRVILQAAKSAEAVMIYLGVLKAGCVFVPLNTAYTSVEVDHFLADAEPRLFIRDAAAFLAEASAARTLQSAAVRADDDIAAIVYTSGTTGRSKGAMLTHSGLRANAEALTTLWAFTAEDRLLHALPIFHVHGLFVALHCALLVGCPMIWLSRFEASEVISALGRSTVMMGVPTFYTRLLQHPGLTRQATAHMRLFISGSAPLLAGTHREFAARTDHAILERYGMTETSMNTSNPYDGERRAGTVGFPLPHIDVRITDPASGTLLPPGADGMIEIRGPNLFKGYWRNPEKTAEEMRADGYFITGDLGHFDGKNYLVISGRAKDLIITGGFNVYPAEVESAIDGRPGVTESAVIGLPHVDFGEAVTAVIASANGIDESTLIADLRKELADFKVPKRVIEVTELPRNTMGKVQKAELRRRYAYLYGAEG